MTLTCARSRPRTPSTSRKLCAKDWLKRYHKSLCTKIWARTSTWILIGRWTGISSTLARVSQMRIGKRWKFLTGCIQPLKVRRASTFWWHSSMSWAANSCWSVSGRVAKLFLPSAYLWHWTLFSNWSLKRWNKKPWSLWIHRATFFKENLLLMNVRDSKWSSFVNFWRWKMTSMAFWKASN